jgi:hypothetical protein
MSEQPVDPCDDGTQNHTWVSITPYCETCGDHDGFLCEVCCEVVHQPYQPAAYDRIEAELARAGTGEKVER